MNSNAVDIKQSYLTERQVALLRQSFKQLNSLQIASRFYHKLFQQYPEVNHLFPADNSELKEKLMSVIELVVFSFEEKANNTFGLQESLSLPLRNLGRKHEEKGVRPEHYPIANELLLQVIEDEVDASGFKEIKEAWRIALNLLSAAMLNSSLDDSLSNQLPESSFFRQVIEGLRIKNMFPL